MESALKDVLLSPTGWQAALIALFSISYAMALQVVLKRQRARRAERRGDLFDVVSRGLENGTISNLADIVNVYKGIMKLPSDDLAYRSGLSAFLREYLVELVGGRTVNTTHETLQEWKDRVTAWLGENERSAPFADVPEVERNLIADIAGFLEAGDREAIRRKLDQLASTVTVREQDYQKIRELNRWSVPLAIVGLVLTIIFGVLSLF